MIHPVWDSLFHRFGSPVSLLSGTKPTEICYYRLFLEQQKSFRGPFIAATANKVMDKKTGLTPAHEPAQVPHWFLVMELQLPLHQ
jgi:hypothetical protein